MIHIAITPAAFDAISATLPLGNVGYENTFVHFRRAKEIEHQIIISVKPMVETQYGALFLTRWKKASEVPLCRQRRLPMLRKQ